MQEKEQKISPIKQRILQYADTLGVSKRAFYAAIGVSRGTLEAKTGITEEVLTKFIATYPSVSLSWLILGEGDMIDKKTTPADENLLEVIADQQKTIKYLREKLEAVEAKGGSEAVHIA